MVKSDEKLLEDLCIQTSEYLWNMGTAGNGNHGGQRLLYPTYSDHKNTKRVNEQETRSDSESANPKRVSEQEARFAFVEVLAQRKEELFYTVETPTKLRYSFTGDSSRSACTDMSLYKDSVLLANIEFKAHQPKQNQIDKDITKLVREQLNPDIPERPLHGIWFHLLQNYNAGTLCGKNEGLFHKFRNTRLLKAEPGVLPEEQDIKVNILFCICVRKYKFLMYGWIRKIRIESDRKLMLESHDFFIKHQSEDAKELNGIIRQDSQILQYKIESWHLRKLISKEE